jgi:hypothetical protein
MRISQNCCNWYAIPPSVGRVCPRKVVRSAGSAEIHVSGDHYLSWMPTKLPTVVRVFHFSPAFLPSTRVP